MKGSKREQSQSCRGGSVLNDCFLKPILLGIVSEILHTQSLSFGPKYQPVSQSHGLWLESVQSPLSLNQNVTSLLVVCAVSSVE